MPAPPVIVDYDADWPLVAADHLERIRASLQVLSGSGQFRFDHIGSTAVPGLAAKPIVDLQVRTPALPRIAELEELLAPTGFRRALGARPDSPGVHRDNPRPEGGDPERYEKRLFVKDRPAVILHIRRLDSPFAAFVLRFRDWLREHPEDAARYQRVKRDLAVIHAGDPDYDDYTRGKTAFLDEFDRMMRT